jgi:hypothetical protein
MYLQESISLFAFWRNYLHAKLPDPLKTCAEFRQVDAVTMATS